jgi:hypothetical protein
MRLVVTERDPNEKAYPRPARSRVWSDEPAVARFDAVSDDPRAPWWSRRSFDTRSRRRSPLAS